MGFKETSSVHVAFMRRAKSPACTALRVDPEDGKEVPPYANPGQSAAWVGARPRRTQAWQGALCRSGRETCGGGVIVLVDF